jgi:hypothetical protein
MSSQWAICTIIGINCILLAIATPDLVRWAKRGSDHDRAIRRRLAQISEERASDRPANERVLGDWPRVPDEAKSFHNAWERNK